MQDTRGRLGQWRLERMLGRDVSGSYYAGRRDDGLRASLYLPVVGVARRRPAVARLLEAHRGLAHDALVRFHDLEHDHGEPFLIGEPVDDALGSLRGAARPAAGQLTAIAAAVAEALIDAHRAGVFHGGLELDHVLWAPGLAPRVLGAGAAVLDLADTDVLERGDVVALGRLICALVAGRQAPGDAALHAVAQQLAEPSRALTMRMAHALLIGPDPDGTDTRLDGPTCEGPTLDYARGPTVPRLASDELRELGRYRILGRLGRGGMGEVLLAEDPALHRGVAIKRIRPDLAHDPTFRARLRREAQLAARLCHRAIVQVFDLITSDGVDHLVMEYVAGPSLHTMLAGAPMAVAEVLRIAIELADGLAYAHHHQVLHRDLKLENVLVGADGQPKLADFGIARQLAGPGPDTLTGHGALVGTLRAMSPEQLLGHSASSTMDARSDLFSFGVLLYELLTGATPFASAIDAETIHRVVYHRQRRCRDAVPAVPRALSELVDQLLEKAPEHRPATARAVGDRLRALASALPITLPVDPMLDPPDPLEPDTSPLPRRAFTPGAGIPVTNAATGSGDYRSWAVPDAAPVALLRPAPASRIQAPFVLAEIRALQASVFRRAPEVQNALAVASRLEHDYDLRRPDLFIPARDTFCAVLAPFSTTVLTGTLRRIGYEIFPQYMTILGIPATDIRAALRLRSGTDLVRLICDAYAKCVVGTGAGELSSRITGTVATVTDTTLMPCQLQIGVFLGAGKLTGLYCDSVLTETRCRLRGDAACVYELAF